MQDISDYKLGTHSDDIVLDSRIDNLTVALALCKQANYTIEIYSRDLEPRLYDESDFVTAIKDFCIRNRRSNVKILVNQPDLAIKSGHRLINLSRQLTTDIQLRKTHDDYAMNPAAFMVADQRAILLRNLASQYDGIANFNAPLKARELLQFFNEAWIHSHHYTDFRRLYI